MCGRFNLRLTSAELSEFFRVLDAPDLGIRFNIAPTQPLAFLRESEGRREWAVGPWGFHPVWAKSKSQILINARAETVLTNRTFSKSARERRCLVPASGFYEWQTVGSAKQPYHITLKTGGPIAFAGIFDHEGALCLMTTAPNAETAEIHDRMPVILPPAVWDHYLDAGVTEPADIEPMLCSLADESLVLTAVSTIVNNARNETPDCIRPA